MKYGPRELKMLLINVLVFVILILCMDKGAHPDTILEVGIGFWAMEVGFFAGKGAKGG